MMFVSAVVEENPTVLFVSEHRHTGTELVLLKMLLPMRSLLRYSDLKRFAEVPRSQVAAARMFAVQSNKRDPGVLLVMLLPKQ